MSRRGKSRQRKTLAGLASAWISGVIVTVYRITQAPSVELEGHSSLEQLGWSAEVMHVTDIETVHPSQAHLCTYCDTIAEFFDHCEGVFACAEHMEALNYARKELQMIEVHTATWGLEDRLQNDE